MLIITLSIFVVVGVFLCFYYYYNNKITTLRRQVIFLTKQNEDLRDKINKLYYSKSEICEDK